MESEQESSAMNNENTNLSGQFEEEEDDDLPEIDPSDIIEVIDLPEEVPLDLINEAEDETDFDAGEAEDKFEMEVEPEDTAALTLTLHSDSVYAVAVCKARPDLVLTGGGDDHAFLIKLAYIPSLPPPPSAPPEGASTSSGTWAIESAQELGGHTDSVTAVGFSVDGQMAATGSYDGTVKIWDTSTAQLMHTLEGPMEIDWLCWHSKGNALLAGSHDCTVWMWLAKTGQCMQVFAGHTREVTCGMFSADGTAILTGSADCSVKIWAPKTGACKHTFSGHGFHEAPVNCIACHPDGTLLLTGAQDGNLCLMNIKTFRILALIAHQPAAAQVQEGADEACCSVESVGFFGSCSWIASGGSDGNLRIWDISGSTPMLRHSCKHGGSVTKLHWHPSDPVVFSASIDSCVRVWDARTGDCKQVFTGHKDMVLDLALQCVLSKEFILLSSSDDHSVKLFHGSLLAI